MATVGPSSESARALRAMLLAGMDVTRLNMSHGTRSRHARVVRHLRKLAKELAQPVAIILDLSGPKIRTGRIRNGSVKLRSGSHVRICGKDLLGDQKRFSVSYPRMIEEVRAGDRILLSDGEIELKALSPKDGELRARVVHGGILGERKGVNLPETSISLPSVTEKDVEDLRFGIEQGVSWVAQSFVRRAEDCRSLRQLLQDFGSKTKLIAKIEKPEAMDDLHNILDVVDGVMVARGDLAVETSPEVVPVLQKKIIAEAIMAQKTVITATQMLQSMIDFPRPTRAEASDVANAVLDGSEALMLSGETAVGRFPVDSVAMMDRIIRKTETSADAKDWAQISRLSTARQESGNYGPALAEAALYAATELQSRIIVTFTHSGTMARCVAALRPDQRIIALTPNHDTYEQLSLSWGVEPNRLRPFSSRSRELLNRMDTILLKNGLATEAETVVVIAGTLAKSALSNSMKLHRVRSS